MCNMKTHVRSVHDETKSWCSEILGNEFYLKDVNQAVLNGLHASQVITCVECTNLIIETLVKGRDKHE